MRRVEYTYWQDGEFFLGHLNAFPEYEAQAYSKEELVENLVEILNDAEAGEIPFIRYLQSSTTH